MPTLSQNTKAKMLGIQAEMMSRSASRCQTPARHTEAGMKT